MLGDHSYIIRGDTQCSKLTDKRRITAAAGRCKRPKPRGGDRCVGAVCERVSVPDDGCNRKAEFHGQVTARDEYGPPALGFEEPSSATVVRPGEEPAVNTFAVHLLRVGRGIHIAETVYRLDANIIDRTGNNKICLAELNLINALLKRYGCSCTGGYRLYHIAVTANIGLHYMCRNNIRQCFLKDIRRVRLAQVTVYIQLPHGIHAAETGALR